MWTIKICSTSKNPYECKCGPDGVEVHCKDEPVTVVPMQDVLEALERFEREKAPGLHLDLAGYVKRELGKHIERCSKISWTGNWRCVKPRRHEGRCLFSQCVG